MPPHTNRQRNLSTNSDHCPENLRPFPVKQITTHHTDSNNAAITLTRPVDSTDLYSVSYPTHFGVPATVTLHFATEEESGLTNEVLLAILVDRLEHMLEKSDAPDSVTKAWQIAVQCMMALPPLGEP